MVVWNSQDMDDFYFTVKLLFFVMSVSFNFIIFVKCFFILSLTRYLKVFDTLTLDEIFLLIFMSQIRYLDYLWVIFYFIFMLNLYCKHNSSLNLFNLLPFSWPLDWAEDLLNSYVPELVKLRFIVLPHFINFWPAFFFIFHKFFRAAH